LAAVQGFLERFENGRLIGWAWNGEAGSSTSVEFRVDGEVAGRAVADVDRPDLKEVGIGTGFHGFIWRVPLKYHDGRSHRFEAAIAGSDWVAPGGFEHEVPAARLEMAIGIDGRLAGYLLNPVEPNEPSKSPC
jgi:hypothetical protein